MNISKVFKFLSVVMIFVLLVIIVFKGWQAKITEEANHMENTPVDVCRVANGIYDGHSEIGPVVVDVRVSVEAGKILAIELLRHENGLGQAANAIIEEMIQQNTYDVDIVSGATVSSKVIINAVNKALLTGVVND